MTYHKLYSKNLVLALLIIALSAFLSCKVTLVPPYNTAISAQIDDTAKAVDKFYLSMKESTIAENNGRAYHKLAEHYVNIEAELNSLLNKNKIRPLNSHSVRICEITLQLWQKYKEEHKTDNTLNDGLIQLNRSTFDNLFFAMQVAEKAKDIVSNPPQ